MAALGYPGAKISLKEDVVPTLFPVVEAMLMPSIRITGNDTSVDDYGMILGRGAKSPALAVELTFFSSIWDDLSAYRFSAEIYRKTVISRVKS